MGRTEKKTTTPTEQKTFAGNERPTLETYRPGFETCCLSSCESFSCPEGYAKKIRAQDFSCAAGGATQMSEVCPWAMDASFRPCSGVPSSDAFDCY